MQTTIYGEPTFFRRGRFTVYDAQNLWTPNRFILHERGYGVRGWFRSPGEALSYIDTMRFQPKE